MRITTLFIIFMLASGCLQYTNQKYSDDKNYLDCKNQSNEPYYFRQSSTREYHSLSPQEVCLVKLAEKYSDIGICNEVRNYNFEPDVDHCYEVAVHNNNISKCDRLQLDLRKQACMRYFVSKNANNITDWSICEKFTGRFFASEPGKTYTYNPCYAAAAKETLNVSYCDKFVEPPDWWGVHPDRMETKADCYTYIAIETKNPLLCEKIKRKDECLLDFNKSTKY